MPIVNMKLPIAQSWVGGVKYPRGGACEDAGVQPRSIAFMSQFQDSIDKAANYAARGRRYKQLPDAELGRRWAEAVRATIAQPDNLGFRLAEEDLFAEHQLRRLTPPHEMVSADREHLLAQLAAKLKELDHLELAALRTGRACSERGAYEKHLKRAEDALTLGRVRIAKQHAVLRSLARR